MIFELWHMLLGAALTAALGGMLGYALTRRAQRRLEWRFGIRKMPACKCIGEVSVEPGDIVFRCSLCGGVRR